MGNHIALLAALLAATVSWSYGDNTDEQIPSVLGESYDFGAKLHLKLEVISSSIQGWNELVLYMKSSTQKLQNSSSRVTSKSQLAI